MNLDYNAAKQAGYSDAEIQQFAQQQGAKINTTQQPVQQAPQQQPAPQPQQQEPQVLPQFANGQTAMQPKSNPWDVRDWLPTIGAVAAPLAADLVTGGTAIPADMAIAGGGAALGEAAKEWLKGEQTNPGEIAKQGLFGGLGEGGGQVIGKVAGKVLGGAAGKMSDQASKLLGNITGKDLGKVLDPVLSDSVNYTKNLKSLEATASHFGLTDGTPQDLIQKTSDVITSLDKEIKSNPAMNNPLDTQAALNDFNAYIKAKGYSNNPEYAPLIKDAQDRILNIGHDGTPSGILGPDGQPIRSAGNATIKSAYDLKSQIADEALNSAFAKKIGQRTLTPDENMNMALYNSIKNSLDAQADPSIRLLNQQQNNLFNIGKAYAKAAGKNGNPALFSLKDILFGVGLGSAGGPVGMGLGLAGEAATKSPSAMLKGAELFGGAAGKAQTAAGAVGAGVASAGTQFANGQPAIGGSPVDTGAGSLQGVQKTATGGVQLPQLQAQGVQQAYPYENYISDMQRADGDPVTQDKLTKMFQASQTAANSYVNNNQLNGDEQSSMRDAYNLNYLMNSVRDQMSQFPPSVIYHTPISELASMGGDYAKLATAMQMLRADLGKQLQGGVLRGYDITNLNVTPNITDTPQAAIAKLDQVQNLLAQRYMNLYGKYGMNTQTAPQR